jgi:hypothetical protein
MKNRLFNEVVNFKQGSYMIYCVTDDNHSSLDWNDAPPYDPESWGLTLLATNGSNYIRPFEKERTEDVLAEVSRVGNDERVREFFEMPRDGYVDIYAIGEGSGGEMYDYAWIDDTRSHNVVWTMDYYETKHAGGARKNRQASTRLYLEAGEYLVYYKTDGTHAFGDWNEAPPYDPTGWGVRITLVSDGAESL